MGDLDVEAAAVAAEHPRAVELVAVELPHQHVGDLRAVAVAHHQLADVGVEMRRVVVEIRLDMRRVVVTDEPEDRPAAALAIVDPA
ncbi:MAG: hypothetical protein M5U09_18480 [Gammaproteobacteria bacterium]|nr:hypothetical protein [Gammaproteobacteria bacterium]